jgi:hypothetical protein
MRYIDKPTVGWYDVWIIRPDGSREWSYESYTYPQNSEWFVRSDILKNPLDPVTRWRSPSAYSWEVHERTGWFGDYTYQAWPGDFRRLFSGALNQSFAAMPYYLPELQWPEYPSSLSARAEINCLLKARDMKVDLASAFAEGRKCVSGIAERTLKVLNAYSAVRKGKWKQGARYLGYTPNPKRMGKGAASDWLELQYGWIPLLNDIYGLHEEFNRDTVVEAFRFSVVSEAWEPINLVNIDAGISAGSHAMYDFIGKKYYRCSLTWEVDDDTYVIASRIGLTNPAEVAWNLVPWSFVADWFVPVGDWLGAVSAAVGLRFVGGTGSRGTKYTYHGRTKDAGQAAFVASSVKCSGTYHMGGRGIYRSSPMPLPYVKNPLSTQHVTNAVALIRSVRR